MQQVIVDIITNVGAIGLLGLILWYTLTKMNPAMLKSFEKHLTLQRDDFKLEIKNERNMWINLFTNMEEKYRSQIELDQCIRQQLNNNLTEIANNLANLKN